MRTLLHTLSRSRASRDRLSAVALSALAIAWISSVAPRSAAAQSRAMAQRPAAAAGAWSLPDAESLVRQAIARIIAQDRPAGIPFSDYSAKLFGRNATADAVRQYSGRSLDSVAFAPIATWPDSRALDVVPCDAVGGVGCQVPSAVWLAVTKIERGDLPHEIHLWYTTQFTAAPALQGQLSQNQRYTFCERWLRVGGYWKYDGFVRVVRQ